MAIAPIKGLKSWFFHLVSPLSTSLNDLSKEQEEDGRKILRKSSKSSKKKLSSEQIADLFCVSLNFKDVKH